MKRIMIALWALVAIAAGAWLWVYLAGQTGKEFCPGDLTLPGGEQIGGPIDAINGDGEPVTTEDVVDGLALVYFGYTFCPDICPIDTVRNAEITDILEAQGIDLTPIFITIDPARDTPEVMKDFTYYTHPKMIGLTGSQEQIDKMVADFKVIAQKEETDDSEFYTMNHTGFSYLLDPSGKLITPYSRAQSAEEIAEGIACHAQKLGLEWRRAKVLYSPHE